MAVTKITLTNRPAIVRNFLSALRALFRFFG